MTQMWKQGHPHSSTVIFLLTLATSPLGPMPLDPRGCRWRMSIHQLCLVAYVPAPHGPLEGNVITVTQWRCPGFLRTPTGKILPSRKLP